jgi:hypothetical protein
MKAIFTCIVLLITTGSTMALAYDCISVYQEVLTKFVGIRPTKRLMMHGRSFVVENPSFEGVKSQREELRRIIGLLEEAYFFRFSPKSERETEFHLLKQFLADVSQRRKKEKSHLALINLHELAETLSKTNGYLTICTADRLFSYEELVHHIAMGAL